MAINNNQKLFSNFISLTIVQGINLLIPILIMPYVISKIGSDEYGAIAIAQVVMFFLSAISDYGFNISATKDIALHKEDNLKISKIFFTVMASKFLITVVLFILLLAVAFFTPALNGHADIYIYGFAYVLGQSVFAYWFFQGFEKMHYITICSLFSRLIFVALVFVFIHNKGDAHYFLFFLGMGHVIAGALSIFLAVNIFKLKFMPPTWGDIIHEIKEEWQITISNLSINTFLYSGYFILRLFTNDQVVGYYSIAERIFFAARQVLAILSQVIYPHICQITQKGKEATRLFFRQVYLPFLVATVAGSAVLFIFSPQLIHIFIKDESALPALLLRILSFVPVIVCLNIPAYQLLLAFEHKKSYLKIFTLATILNIIVNILLVRTWGATGTALSVMITELFITIGLNVELYKNHLGGFVRAGKP